MLRLNLASAPLFHGLDADGLSWVAAHSEMISVPRGEVVIEEGAAPDYFYVVVHGSLEVFRAGSESNNAIDVLRDGEAVGEMAVLLGGARSARKDRRKR